MTEVLERANQAALQMVRSYQALPLFGQEVVAPYHYNYLGLELGQRLTDEVVRSAVVQDLVSGALTGSAYLGKGTPEQLVQAARARLAHDVSGSVAPERLRDLMQLHGIGVDCSGFAYHVLAAAWAAVFPERPEGFEDQLSWADSARRGVRRAGSPVFTVGEPVTDAWRPLDMLVLTSDQGEVDHVALLLWHKGQWLVAQSSRWSRVYGVSLEPVVEGSYDFPLASGVSWDQRGVARYRLRWQ